MSRRDVFYLAAIGLCLLGLLYCAVYWRADRQCYTWTLPLMRCEVPTAAKK